jgi:phosphatidylglycerophosphate synthase
MLDREVRVYKERLLNPIADGLGRAVHPTTITLIGAAFGVGAGVAAWQQMYWVGLGLWAVNRILDGLDGTVARRTNQQSDLGGYIDIVLDDLVYSLIVLLFAVGINTPQGYIAAGFLLVTYRVNAASWLYLASLLEKKSAGAKANKELTSITMPPGLIEGTETVIFYAFLFALPMFGVPLMWVFGVLVALTVVQRLVWAVRNLD